MKNDHCVHLLHASTSGRELPEREIALCRGRLDCRSCGCYERVVVLIAPGIIVGSGWNAG